MRRIMILTASTGGGHNQAAESLKDLFKSYGDEVVIVDFLKLMGKVVEKLVVGGYSILYSNLPYIYKELYKYSNKKDINSKISNYALRIFEKKIHKTIIEQNPDLIIGTHPFVVNIICKLKKNKYLYKPFISIITDFKAHSLYVNDNVDAYITASEYTRLDMIKKGICKDKIYPYGIPIRKDFFQRNINTKTDSRKFTILLMGGSTGVQSIEDVLSELIGCRNHIKIIVICGKNAELMESIKMNYSCEVENKEIVVYGFTNCISQLMEEADLLISKPGGVTVTEAIVKNLPMVIPFMIPGQEEENAEFLTKSGVAKIVKDIKMINIEIDNLIDNPVYLNIMRNNMSKLFEVYSIDSIVDLGNKIINEYGSISYYLKAAK